MRIHWPLGPKKKPGRMDRHGTSEGSLYGQGRRGPAHGHFGPVEHIQWRHRTESLSPGPGARRPPNSDSLLKAIIDLCTQIDTKNGNNDLISHFDQVVGHTQSPSAIFENRNSPIKWSEMVPVGSYRITAANLKPGDRVWIKNPYFGQNGDTHGTQGSNEIYIGGDQFVGFDGRVFSSLGALQTYVLKMVWCAGRHAVQSCSR